MFYNSATKKESALIKKSGINDSLKFNGQDSLERSCRTMGLVKVSIANKVKTIIDNEKLLIFDEKICLKA